MMAQFDAINYLRQLEAEGVPREQAKAHAHALVHALDNYVAQPQDLEQLKEEIFSQIAATETRIRADLRADIAASEARLRAEIMGLNVKIGVLEAKLDNAIRFQNWINAVMIAMLAGLYVQLNFR